MKTGEGGNFLEETYRSEEQNDEVWVRQEKESRGTPALGDSTGHPINETERIGEVGGKLDWTSGNEVLPNYSHTLSRPCSRRKGPVIYNSEHQKQHGDWAW